MAIVRNNLVTKGLSGSLGKTLVFRNVNGQTVVSTSPTSTAEPTEAQVAQRARFQQAVVYAKGQMSDPDTAQGYKEAAQRKGVPNAYNVAVADFFYAPKIELIDFTGYEGRKGNKIRVKAFDDYKVARVVVEITNPDGSQADYGEARPVGNGIDWEFTATKNNDSLDGDKVTVTAFDMAGNTGSKEEGIA